MQNALLRQKILSQIPDEIQDAFLGILNYVPVLDPDGTGICPESWCGTTGYIDNAPTEAFRYPISIGLDVLNRSLIALRYPDCIFSQTCRIPDTHQILFQRYSDCPDTWSDTYTRVIDIHDHFRRWRCVDNVNELWFDPDVKSKFIQLAQPIRDMQPVLQDISERQYAQVTAV